MKFYLVNNETEFTENNSIYLIHDNWDDYFEFEISYYMFFKYNGKINRLGRVKIAKKNQKDRVADIPSYFEKLSDEYFSIGFSEDYYEEIKKFKYHRDTILKGINDIAYNLKIYDEVFDHEVTCLSIMREYTENMLKGILNRLAHGKARLTDYNLKYVLPLKSTNNEKVLMDFEVKRYIKPHSNIHVIIGKNGIGKTTLLKNIVLSLAGSENKQEVGEIENIGSERFANIVFVSFSAFDIPLFDEDIEKNIKKESLLKYNYVGLQQKGSVKGTDTLVNEFVDITKKFYWDTSKLNLWNDTIDILYSDDFFKDNDVKSWISEEKRELWKNCINKNYRSLENSEKWEKIFQWHADNIKTSFYNLSSGHKIILLTLANLINYVEEKTIVFIDEPEEHLHPPLVAAFIQALSNILVYRNGMGIVATHSPVVVQEVPKACVWKISRSGNYMKPMRPECETYGENLGELTTEIFAYEVKEAGFHKEIRKAINSEKNYNDALAYFNNQLGKEAKSILRAYSYKYEKKHEADN